MGAFPIETEFPAQMVLPLPAYTDGSELTLMVTESDLLQPVAVTVSVRRYTVADAGETYGLLIAETNPEGLLVQV